LFALDKATGKQVWAHDFMKEYKAPPPGRGYTCSPIVLDEDGNLGLATVSPQHDAVRARQENGCRVRARDTIKGITREEPATR
jgi:hypothetical protein